MEVNIKKKLPVFISLSIYCIINIISISVYLGEENLNYFIIAEFVIFKIPPLSTG